MMSNLYKNHVVAIVDILGFKDALLDEEKAKKILDILKKLKNMERVESAVTIQTQGTCTEIQVSPAITTFSDLIVISVSEENLTGTASWRNAIYEILHIIQYLTRGLLYERFLLRGGITLGKLYHQEGIIFGEGMVDAYNIESKIAKYPRVVASAELVKCFAVDRIWKTPNYFYQDGDQACLDYMPEMLGKMSREDQQGMREIIQENIIFLEEEGKKEALVNWRWFAEAFEKSMSRSVWFSPSGIKAQLA